MSTPDDRAEFENSRRRQSLALGNDEKAFRLALDALVAADKHDYGSLWTWMGLPIIQLPADVMATQEVIWSTKPEIIIETGVARGGSLVFMAALLELLGRGRVIGVDIDIRPHNREAIEIHPMAHRISLLEGSSIAPATIARVRELIPAGAATMVILDSDHSRKHVLEELRVLAPLVTKGCYLVVADTALGHLDVDETPRKRSKVLYKGDEPLTALREYLSESDRFDIDPVLNGKLILSSSPGGYLRCVRS